MCPAAYSTPDAQTTDDVITWLLGGDPAIQYQVHRDLLGHNDPALRRAIAAGQWASTLLAHRNPSGTWGRGFYQPKWTSTHYTLLDLRNLCLDGSHPVPRESVVQLLDREKGQDGGLNPSPSMAASDVCINGMALNYASYFEAPALSLQSIVDFLLKQVMPDGGFNCRSNRSGARHSSLHSTLSVLEGILAYRQGGYRYRLDELETAARSCEAFVLLHRFFRSDHTGDVIDARYLSFPVAPRWKYNVLRALDYFRAANRPFHPAMTEALALIVAKRAADGRWKANAAWPGKVHLEFEAAGQPSRLITLAAMRVLAHYRGGDGE